MGDRLGIAGAVGATFFFFLKNLLGQKVILEAPGIDPGTSRMLSERSTI